MICKHCGAEIDDNAAACMRCGSLVQKKKKPAAKRPWFIILLVFCKLAVICGVWAIIFIVGGEPSPEEFETAVPSTQEPTEEQTEPTLSPEDQFISDFCESSGLNQEIAENLYSLLSEQLLCEDIEFVGNHEQMDYNYILKADGYKLVATADNDGVYRVACGDFNMFGSEGVKYTMQDIKDRDMSNYSARCYAITEEIIKQNMLSPSSCKLAPMHKCGMARNGSLVAVRGTVEGQNAFGVMIQNDFVVEFVLTDFDNYGYDLVFLRIGNEQSGEFISLD